MAVVTLAWYWRGSILDQEVAFVDELPFTVVDRGDDAGDLADHGGGVDRGDGANGVKEDVDVALLGGFDVDGDGAAPGSATASGGWGGGGFAVHDPPEEGQEEQKDDHPDDDAHPAGSLGRRELVVWPDVRCGTFLHQ